MQWMYPCTYIHTHNYIYICTHAHMHTHTLSHIHTNVYAWMYALYLYIFFGDFGCFDYFSFVPPPLPDPPPRTFIHTPSTRLHTLVCVRVRTCESACFLSLSFLLPFSFLSLSLFLCLSAAGFDIEHQTVLQKYLETLLRGVSALPLHLNRSIVSMSMSL